MDSEFAIRVAVASLCLPLYLLIESLVRLWKPHLSSDAWRILLPLCFFWLLIMDELGFGAFMFGLVLAVIPTWLAMRLVHRLSGGRWPPQRPPEEPDYEPLPPLPKHLRPPLPSEQPDLSPDANRVG